MPPHTNAASQIKSQQGTIRVFIRSSPGRLLHGSARIINPGIAEYQYTARKWLSGGGAPLYFAFGACAVYFASSACHFFASSGLFLTVARSISPLIALVK